MLTVALKLTISCSTELSALSVTDLPIEPQLQASPALLSLLKRTGKPLLLALVQSGIVASVVPGHHELLQTLILDCHTR